MNIHEVVKFLTERMNYQILSLKDSLIFVATVAETPGIFWGPQVPSTALRAKAAADSHDLGIQIQTIYWIYWYPRLSEWESSTPTRQEFRMVDK